jgi:hypothetical protein
MNQPTEQKSEGNFLTNYWNGKQPLWKAYWVLLFGQLALQAALAVTLRSMQVPYNTSMTVGKIVIAPMLVFWAVSLWRCASKSHFVWKFLARTGAISLCFFAVLVLVDLIVGKI